MKTIFLLLTVILSLSVSAQDKNKKKLETIKFQIEADTLILHGKALPKPIFLKIDNDVFLLCKEGPGSYTIVLPEVMVVSLFRQLELSTGSHIQVEQLKKLIRDQLLRPKTKK